MSEAFEATAYDTADTISPSIGRPITVRVLHLADGRERGKLSQPMNTDPKAPEGTI